jgi:hypothetical protein
VLALLEGRYVRAVHREGGRFVLDRRHPWQIAAKPAGATYREDVMREHRCSTPPIGDQLAAPTSFGEAVTPLPAGATPDF